MLQGLLVESHLAADDLRDIALFLRHHGLLAVSGGGAAALGQLVVWREVFPWRRCHAPLDPLIPGFTEPDARWFLLVVGQVSCLSSSHLPA